MKKRLGVLILTLVILAAFCAQAFAADSTSNGFYDIATEENVMIKPFSGNTEATPIEQNLDSDEALEKWYVDSNRLKVTYSAALVGKHYGVMLAKGDTMPTNDDEIFYMDQKIAQGSSVEFNVYPLLPQQTTNMSLYISSNAQDFEIIKIPLSYAVGFEIGKNVLPGTVTLAGTTELVATIENAPSEENYSIVWLRNGNVIEDANAATYTVVDADKGCSISVKLVAKGDTYTGEVISNIISIPALAPSFTSAPTLTAGDGSITVSFSAQANGSEITGYEIFVNGASNTTLDGSQTSYTITGLTNGTAYTVKVAATNGIGTTVSSEATATPHQSNTGTGGGGGGGVTPSYSISASTTSGGNISISSKNASAGSTVTINVTPDEGYEISKITVLDKDGNEVAVTKEDENYTFKMPKGAVTISAEFAEIEKEDEQTPATSFADVTPTAYYFDAVNWAVKNNITAGTGENEFSPDDTCTRSQMVTFLWRAAGSPKAQNANDPFTDIEKDSYYYDAVMWAVENEITSGVAETSFDPDGIVSRAQSVTFLYRLANAVINDVEHSFDDVDRDAYYNDAIAWASQEDITHGLTDTSFGPDDVCTRAQIVTFIYRHFVK